MRILRLLLLLLLAPVWPLASLAVQLIVCRPAPLIVSGAGGVLLPGAVGVLGGAPWLPRPLVLLRVPPVQLRLVSGWLLRLLAVRLPLTGPCVNQPSARSGLGSVSWTSGSVSPALGKCASDQGLASRPASLTIVCVPS